MTTAKLFLNGRSQAVRLPKEFRFAGTEVTVERLGDGVVLRPKACGFDALFEAAAQFGPEFLKERDQGLPQERPPMFP